MTNKQRWRKERNIEYLRLEARPARCTPNEVSIELEWCPPSGSGAYEAFNKLQQVVLKCGKTTESSQRFYAELLKFLGGYDHLPERQ